MLTGKYERFQAVLVSNLRAWRSNVTAVLAIPTGVTPVGWRGETKWKSSLDLRGARSGIPNLSSKWDLQPTDAALHKCLFPVLYSSAVCKQAAAPAVYNPPSLFTHARRFCSACGQRPFKPRAEIIRWFLCSGGHAQTSCADSRGISTILSSVEVIYTEPASFIVGLGRAKRIISLSNTL